MKSVPKGEHNAIDSATFALNLGRLPDAAAFQRLSDALTSLADELPGVERRQGIRMHIRPGQAPVQSQSEHTDIARFFAGPAGEHQWRVSLEGAILSVRCQKYTRYDEVWAKAHRYLELCQQAIGEDLPAQEASLQIIDRFDYVAEDGVDLAESYHITELFQRDSLYLTPKAYTAGLLWHVFQGWFDHCGDGRQHLHQLNISSTPTEDGSFAAVIDYRGSANLADITTQALTSCNMEAISAIFAHLHKSNTELVQSLLVPEHLAAIGLGSNT